MCGRFQLKPSGELELLVKKVKAKGTLTYADDVAPGSSISFIHEGKEGRVIDTAIWWLFIDPATLKPNYKYASFNSRSDRLNEPQAIAYKPFRQSRCLIPATAFVEGLGDKKTYHMIEIEGRAIAFGGLYKEHVDQETGEIVYSTSIITLPPVEKWGNIHPKSISLMLDYENEALIDQWLDPSFSGVETFSNLLLPEIAHTQRITPIEKPSTWKPVGESYLLS